MAMNWVWLRRLWPLDTISRISIGIASLVVLCLMVVDYTFSMVPNPVHQEMERRRLVSQQIAEQVVLVATRLGVQEAHQVLYSARRREAQIVGIALRSERHEVVAVTGVAPEDEGADFKGTSRHIRIPVMLQGKPWGWLDLRWTPIPHEGFPDELFTPQSAWPLMTYIGLAILLRLYLSKVLKQLDPSGAVPERVHQAYNTLTEGVAMLDAAGRIILVNEALRELVGQRSIQIGQALEEHDWFKQGAKLQGREYPWSRALRTGESVSREPMRLVLGNDRRSTLVSCLPIAGAGKQKKAQGCLVVVADQTSIERKNEELRETMTQLQAANGEISRQNEVLVRLATRDPMTDCLNRRAFFDKAGALKDECNLENRTVAVVMCDIDHFKSFNDKYGHSIGDEVIKAVAGIYNRTARAQDMVCRYGGEEFCILLPNCDGRQAMAFGEVLRKTVQEAAGAGIDYEPRLTVTSSFGLAITRSTKVSLAELIDQADQALYHSKRNGRNRCTLYEPGMAAEAALPPPPPTPVAAALPNPTAVISGV